MSDSPLLTGNRVLLLQGGADTYRAMFSVIMAARDHINTETYILEDDEVGRRFADALNEKQRQGVQVNLIYDSVGTLRTPAEFFQRLRDRGIRTLEFNPVNPPAATAGWDVNRRDHRKLLINDGRTVFLGGINISSVYSGGSSRGKTKANAQKDEFESIKEKILEADGLVLASPNYIYSVSAQLKAFMDRCCGVVHCMAFEGKYGASVITSGGGDEEPIAQFMNHFLITTGVTPVGAVWATMGAIAGEDLPEEILRQARDLGKRLVTSWKERIQVPEAQEVSKSFRERMRNLMLYRKEDWPYEYAFWKKHRGLK